MGWSIYASAQRSYFFIYPAFLLIPALEAKLILLGMLGFLNAGWYSILQGQLYTALPNHAASVELTIGNISGLIASFIPFGVGIVAERVGLDVAMWVMMLGPIALLVGLPRFRAISV